jgi:hypothetical protein
MINFYGNVAINRRFTAGERKYFDTCQYDEILNKWLVEQSLVRAFGYYYDTSIKFQFYPPTVRHIVDSNLLTYFKWLSTFFVISIELGKEMLELSAKNRAHTRLSYPNLLSKYRLTAYIY